MKDPFFGQASVDIDELRDQPVPHRYVHGTFAGTGTRFSIYFPPADRYEGRFLHMIEGGVGGSDATFAEGTGVSGTNLNFPISVAPTSWSRTGPHRPGLVRRAVRHDLASQRRDRSIRQGAGRRDVRERATSRVLLRRERRGSPFHRLPRAWS